MTFGGSRRRLSLSPPRAFTLPRAALGRLFGAAASDVSSYPALFLLLSIVYLAVYLPFLDRFPLVAVDEPWYANTAANFAEGRGLINTNAGSGGGDQLFLYTLILAAASSISGTGLWTGRFVSVLIGLVALWGWGALCRALKVSGWVFALSGLLFVVSNIHFIIFRRVRPEGLVIALSVWALYFFIEAWRTRRFDAAAICALLTGASSLAHPNGALLAVLLGLVLLATALPRHSVRPVVGYAVGGVAVMILLLAGLNIFQEQSLSQFLTRILVDSRRISVSNASAMSILGNNLLSFISSYSLGAKRLYILAFELGILVTGLGLSRRDRISGLLSLIGLLWFILALALLTPFFRWAFSIVALFSLAVTARLLSSGLTTPSPRIVKILPILTLVYGLNTLTADVYVIAQNARNTSYTELTRALDHTVPDGVTVLSHLELWFAFQNNTFYNPFKRWHTTPFAGLTEALQSGQIRYAVLGPAFGDGRSPTTGERESVYRNFNTRFYEEAYAHVRTHCRRVSVLRTRGYGNIEAWECPEVSH